MLVALIVMGIRQRNVMKLVHKKAKNLTPKELKACLSLNMRDQGLMREKLLMCRKEEWTRGLVWMLWIEDKLISWCLLEIGKKNAHSTIAFYTRLTYRGKGYATRLLRLAERKIERLGIEVTFFYHDPKSKALSRKFNTQLIEIR